MPDKYLNYMKHWAESIWSHSLSWNLKLSSKIWKRNFFFLTSCLDLETLASTFSHKSCLTFVCKNNVLWRLLPHNIKNWIVCSLLKWSLKYYNRLMEHFLQWVWQKLVHSVYIYNNGSKLHGIQLLW